MRAKVQEKMDDEHTRKRVDSSDPYPVQIPGSGNWFRYRFRHKEQVRQFLFDPKV